MHTHLLLLLLLLCPISMQKPSLFSNPNLSHPICALQHFALQNTILSCGGYSSSTTTQTSGRPINSICTPMPTSCVQAGCKMFADSCYGLGDDQLKSAEMEACNKITDRKQSKHRFNSNIKPSSNIRSLLTNISTLLMYLALTSEWQRLVQTADTRTAANNYLPPIVKQQRYQQPERDLKWPQRQVNVLVDKKSLNETERAMLAAVFQQLEHKTCLHVHRLSPDRVNPFMARDLDDSERNFLYIFKSPLKSGHSTSGRHPSMGLSSLGCVKQGRQSMVLTDLAFKWPEMLLRYHVMHSLGVDTLERPDGHIRRLLNMLPLNQKITSRADNELIEPSEYSSSGSIKQELASSATTASSSTNDAGHQFSDLSGSSFLDRASALDRPAFIAFATRPTTSLADARQDAELEQFNKWTKSVRTQSPTQGASYLSASDIAKIKQLYDCADYQNRLSPTQLENEAGSDGGSRPSDEQQQQQQQQQSEASNSFAAESKLTGDVSKRSRTESNDQDKRLSESPGSPNESIENGANSERTKPLDSAAAASGDGQQDGQAGEQKSSSIDDATKQIISSLLDQKEDGAKESESKDSKGPNSGQLEPFNPTPPTTTDLPLSANRLECKPLESCPLDTTNTIQQDRPVDADSQTNQERPMILKLDEYHAQDPQLKQANQMKLSQLSNDSLETYRLMNNPSNLADLWMPSPSSGNQLPQQQWQQQQQQQQQQQPSGSNIDWQRPKSEMLISFEQLNNQLKDPISALASSQVLKLCSCTCRTMTPGDGPSQQPPLPPPTQRPAVTPFTNVPTGSPWPPYTIPTDPYPQTASIVTPNPSPPPITMSPYPTGGPSNCTGEDDDDDDDDDCYSVTPPTPPMTPEPQPPVTELPPATPQPSPAPQPTLKPTEAPTDGPPETMPTKTTEPDVSPTPNSTASSDEPASQATSTSPASGLFAANACDQVQWVRPNKTVYASARIVWDVDRANQNYFLCNNQLNGELIPGKTHGFSCKISQEGKAFETHAFSVLTKPEHVNLAWVQKNSNSFGRTNFPVIGGYSKQQDPYIVSRCLVKDENNDIITLIGYINNQGVGWFPFDDIQIECGQYDVLACVN